MSACKSECDCGQDTEPGSTAHAADCNSKRECDEGRWCDRHYEERANEYAWMRRVSLGAVTGVMSDADKQDMRDAGRAYLVRS
jgi:hypothetical protein